MIVLICFWAGRPPGLVGEHLQPYVDAFPKAAVASVTAIGGFAGGLGGLLFSAQNCPASSSGISGSYCTDVRDDGQPAPDRARGHGASLSWRKRRPWFRTGLGTWSERVGGSVWRLWPARRSGGRSHALGKHGSAKREIIWSFMPITPDRAASLPRSGLLAGANAQTPRCCPAPIACGW